MNKSICVVMSTYNGENFIEQQIDSILCQKEVDLDIFVRDDGSTDNTQKILNNYQSEGKLKWYQGINLGPAKSFLDALNKIEKKYDYYAFSDQDDVWKENKLKKAVSLLDKYTKNPALYYSSVTLVDSNLNPLDIEITPSKYNFITSITRNEVVGCTMVLNKVLYSKIRNITPEYLVMHDQWINIICNGLGGNIICDKESHILYRQHDKNCIGVKTGIVQKLRNSFIFSNQHLRLEQAKNIKNYYYDELSLEKKKQLDRLINYKKYRFYFLINKDFNFEKRVYCLCVKLAILIGKF